MVSMASVEDILKKYGLTFPAPPAKGGVYEPLKEFGANFCYLSGCTPTFNGETRWTGKLGAEVTVEQGQQAARVCALNLLANINARYGGLDAVKRIVKMTAFIAVAGGFCDHPKVANGASRLLIDIFGEDAGRCARSAVGVSSLPGNAPVEIELLVEMKA